MLIPIEGKEILKSAYLRAKDLTPTKKEKIINEAIATVKKRYPECFREGHVERQEGFSRKLYEKAVSLAKDGYLVHEIEQILGCDKALARKAFKEVK